jgi:endoplasmic reticulum Man9GlcNAc2 1,2-alpha-mannosidase
LDFSADPAKQAAVVSAFRVRPHSTPRPAPIDVFDPIAARLESLSYVPFSHVTPTDKHCRKLISAAGRDAWGFDEYNPIKHKGTNLSPDGGIGYTIVDTIDTMLIMGLDEEFAEARDWVANELTFNRDGKFNTFEITIRVLGGLLSAYHLSNDQIFLDKAIDLAERILPVFETQSRLPLSFVNLAQKTGQQDDDNRGMVSTAEAATLQLEFKYLSHLTDDYAYWNAVEKVSIL